jgi:predicted AAA+ superfamily ATPase
MISSYIDLLVDLLLVRKLRPYSTNAGKRLVKSPKIYVRDSGLVHALLGIDSFEVLAGHPVVGMSWEGFVIESLLAAAPERTIASFYRTLAGAEIDLLLELPGNRGRWAIEIKRSLSPKAERGFHHAQEDLKPDKSFLVYAGADHYPIADGVAVIGVRQLADLLLNM